MTQFRSYLSKQRISFTTELQRSPILRTVSFMQEFWLLYWTSALLGYQALILPSFGRRAPFSLREPAHSYSSPCGLGDAEPVLHFSSSGTAHNLGLPITIFNLPGNSNRNGMQAIMIQRWFHACKLVQWSLILGLSCN